MSPAYSKFVQEQLQPWLNKHVQEGFFSSEDGLRLHYCKAMHPNEKAVIVMVHGFCEFFGKYEETAMRFYDAGYSTYFVELRGHGKSQRTNPQEEDERVTVSSFEEYVQDLHAFMHAIVMKDAHQKYFLYCHSMGGSIGTLYLEEYPDEFACAVLSSPMLQVNYGKVPDGAVAALAIYTKMAHIDEKYAPGQHAFTGKYEYENSNCDDEDRYAYALKKRKEDKDYQTWGGTYSWVRAARDGAAKALRDAYKVKVPVLICQAGNDHAVRLDGQEKFLKECRYASIDRFPESKHELYNAHDSERKRYFHDVILYFDAHL